MENKNNVLLTVIGVATLLVVLVGASFAYFTATGTVTAEDVSTGELKITSALAATSQKDIKPTTFSTSTADSNVDVAKFTFTVNGTGTTVTGATYKIQLLGATTGVGEVADKGTATDVEYALYKGTAADGTMVSTGSFDTINSATIVGSDYALAASTADTYTLYVYIKETNSNQDNLQKVTISATMNALAQTPAPAGA